jgi:CubicO group peptidase (beta-lactamase class C family)
MPEVPIASAEALGLDSARLDRVFALVQHWTETGKVAAAALAVGRRGRMLEPRFFGRQRPGAETALRRDALFLVASITKPVTATAVVLLLERGLVALEDPVSRYVPRFAGTGKADVQLRHLLTHTSGLPDMLPNNDTLRAAHRPLADFVEGACRVPLLFAPGTRVSYQSAGFALLAEVVHQVTGVTLHEFLRQEVFVPLGMTDTSLGWQPEKKERIAAVHLSAEQQKTDWHWNTPYWLGFGAPWGGLVTSPGDFARFCALMLNGGSLGVVRLLSPAAVRALTSNQIACQPRVPEDDRRCRPWGLGWRLNWPSEPGSFGDLLGPRAYGHWGATGTLCWLDPDAELFGILFTTEPQANEERFLARVSNAVMAAVR